MTTQEAKRHITAPVEITNNGRKYNGEIVDVADGLNFILVHCYWPLMDNLWIKNDNVRLQSEVIDNEPTPTRRDNAGANER